jgi:hypothetical protein
MARLSERDRNIARYGALVVRVTDRMQQFRGDRLKSMVFPQMAEPEGLSRYDEAAALVAIVRAHDGPSGIDAHNDAGEGERLYGLGVGHVLTDADVRDIESLLADHNDAIGHEADKWHEARVATLREIGGDELVAAAEAKDEALCDAAVQKALAAFRKRTTELNAESLRRCVKSPGDLRGSCLACGADSEQACLLAPEVV